MAKQCLRKDFHQAQHRSTRWLHIADSDVTAQDLERPDYWLPVTKEPIRVGDTIVVQREDMKLYAEVLVTVVATTGLRVEFLNFKEFKSVEDMAGVSSEYKVEFRGMKTKWAVVRVSDSRVIKGGLDTEDEANAFRKNHAKALA